MRLTIPPILRQRWRGCLIGGLLGLILATGFNSIFGAWAWKLSYDLPYLTRNKITPGEVVIIYLDDKSRENLRQGYGTTWDRAKHAELLDRLMLDQPKLVVFDIVFSRTNDAVQAAADKALAAAIQRSGKVILAGVSVPDMEQGEGKTVHSPVPEFMKAALGWGLSNFDEDANREVRRNFTFDEIVDLPSFPWVASRNVNGTRDAGSRSKERWLYYYGPAGTIPFVYYETALDTNATQGRFKDKVVFIGDLPTASVSGAELESFRTPYTRWQRGGTRMDEGFGKEMPGVEVHATAFLNLHRGESLLRMHPAVEFALLAALGVSFGVGLVLLAPTPASLLALGAGILFSLGAIWMIWTRNVWFAWLIFVAMQLPATFVWSLIYNSVRLHIDKRLLHESLILHLSPARVDQILTNPEKYLKPGAERQEVTIMFTDIANFSKLTSRMEAEDLFRLLNEYFERAIGVITQNDGTVIKLIGDSIFAIWNAPFMQPDQQFRAAQAAVQLQARIIELEAQQRSVPLRTRIGIHTGMAFVGNSGMSKRFDYTAIGDSINLASRLEGLNKHLGTEIMATRELQKIIEPKVTSRRVGFFKFKGFDRVVEVYEILGGVDVAEKTQVWRRIFDEGLFAFQRKEWNKAEESFNEILRMRSEDGPSTFYLKQIAELRSTVLPGEWTGEIEMREK